MKRSKPKGYNSKNSSIGCSINSSCEKCNAFLSLDVMKRKKKMKRNLGFSLVQQLLHSQTEGKKDFSGGKTVAVSEFEVCEDAGCGL